MSGRYGPASPMGRGRPVGSWTARDSWLRPHGTRAARRRHRYRGEPLCAPCQAEATASAITWAEEKAQRRPHAA